MSYELPVIRDLPKQQTKAIRVTFSSGTMAHMLLTMIAKSENVHVNEVVRAMVKAALVQWLKHSSSFTEVNDDVKEFMKDG